MWLDLLAEAVRNPSSGPQREAARLGSTLQLFFAAGSEARPVQLAGLLRTALQKASDARGARAAVPEAGHDRAVLLQRLCKRLYQEQQACPGTTRLKDGKLGLEVALDLGWSAVAQRMLDRGSELFSAGDAQAAQNTMRAALENWRTELVRDFLQHVATQQLLGVAMGGSREL